MYYSTIGILALLILIIINKDILFNPIGDNKAKKAYSNFLVSVSLYYVTDVFWGILDSCSMMTILFIDTEIYFLSMAFSVFFWTEYVNAYLGENGLFHSILYYVGRIILLSMLCMVVINIFHPLLFYFDAKDVYQALKGRYLILIAQIVILLFSSVYAARTSRKKEKKVRNRYLTISIYGLTVTAFIILQLFFPYFPFYSIAYMIGTCVIYSYIMENEKEEYRQELEKALKKEKEQLGELNEAWELAYTDAMTGAKSKLAHYEQEEKVDKLILTGDLSEMALVVFDINGLKAINDKYGHDMGDDYIIEAFRTICDVFNQSAVFRIGGDEFVAVLEEDDYRNRDSLMKRFNEKMEENYRNDGMVVSAGIAEFDSEKDSCYKDIFNRADFQMYSAKEKKWRGHNE